MTVNSESGTGQKCVRAPVRSTWVGWENCRQIPLPRPSNPSLRGLDDRVQHHRRQALHVRIAIALLCLWWLPLATGQPKAMRSSHSSCSRHLLRASFCVRTRSHNPRKSTLSFLSLPYLGVSLVKHWPQVLLALTCLACMAVSLFSTRHVSV